MFRWITPLHHLAGFVVAVAGFSCRMSTPNAFVAAITMSCWQLSMYFVAR